MIEPFFDPTWFPPAQGWTVLDVGSAEGRLTSHLAASGFHMIGLEVDAELVDRSRGVHGAEFFDMVRGDATSMPFATSSVDGAVVLEVLEHVPDPSRILSECHRVLRPGGRLCVGVPTSYTERVYARLHPRYMTNATHVRVYRRSELVDQIATAGFIVDHVETRNLVPALAWMVHALVRTDADASGHVSSHHRVEPVVQRLVAAWGRAPLVGRWQRALTRRFGKSWYLYASKAPSTAELREGRTC